MREPVEKVKSSINIVDVVGRSVKLDRSNKGKCPFHEDNDPSLSVNPVGQYFYCFGCGVGGDVIRFVELFEHKSFPEALNLLASSAGINIPDMDYGSLQELDSQRQIEGIRAEAAQYYHKNLSNEAKEYLRPERQISDESIEKFKIGFANGTLKKHLIETLGLSLERCLESGVLKRYEDGTVKDFFHKRIIFPNLYRGRVIHLTGRSIDDSQPKYLHLPGAIEHFYNEDSLLCDSVVITEGVFDCIAAQQAGHASVALFGTQSFREEHVIRFGRARRVYICMDGDDAGHKATKKIGRLLAEKAIIVSLPDGADPDTFIRTKGKSTFLELINNGKSYVESEIDRIASVPEHLRLEEAKQLLPVLSKLDEFTRSHYRDLISKKLDISKKTIDKGIDQTLEEPVRPPITVKERIPDAPDEEETRKALEILNDPDLLERFHNATEQLGCVGEINNKLLVFLTLTSRILSNPINLIVKGDSSGGKSYLVESVSQFFPKDQIMAFTTITPKALYHRQDDLSHKALIIYERPGAEESDYSIRSLQSEKKLVISMSVKDPETGNWIATDQEIPGPIAYIETTTQCHLHAENETRCFEIFIDDSDEQTERIHEVQRRRYSEAGTSKGPDLIPWTTAQSLLKPYRVIIPYIQHIRFPTKPLRVRRDFQRFLTLIEVSTVLHQYQRQKALCDEEECLLASAEDYVLAFSLASDVLRHTIRQLAPKAEELIRHISTMTDGITDKEFTRRVISESVGWDIKTVTKYLGECVQQGLVDEENHGKGRASKYKFVRLPNAYDNMLMSPGELQQILRSEEPSKLGKPVQLNNGQDISLLNNSLGSAHQAAHCSIEDGKYAS